MQPGAEEIQWPIAHSGQDLLSHQVLWLVCAAKLKKSSVAEEFSDVESQIAGAMHQASFWPA